MQVEVKNEGRSRRSLGPLRRLVPYVMRYPGLLAGACVFLLMAAGATLTLPLAVRRMIDHGFTESDSAFIANYFSMLIVVAAVLAVASAGRYLFVITLGERVVADLREDVFAHVMKLSPGFFDREQSGEIVSRLTADATQIKSAVGASGISRAAQHADGCRFCRDDGADQPEALASGRGGHTLHRASAHGLRAVSAAPLPHCARHAGRGNSLRR